MLPPQKPCPFQISQRPLHRPFGKAQVGGDGTNGWKALPILSRPILEIHIYCYRTVRQIGGIDAIKIAHSYFTRTGGFASGCAFSSCGAGCGADFFFCGYFLRIAAANSLALAYLTVREDFSAIS